MIGGAILIIVLSVLSTLWINGFFLSAGHNNNAYRNITFTDAVINCQNETRSRHKNQLQNLTLDDLSSRFDQATNLYRVFFHAQVSNSSRDSAAKDIYISCLVSAGRGKITAYEAFEKKETPTEPIRQEDGRLFGWP